MTTESQRVYFQSGDVVGLKGIENPTQRFEMKVKQIVWATKNDGSLKVRVDINPDGSKRERKELKGILCEWINEKGDTMLHMFDSRDLYQIKRSPLYYLQEAKKALLENKLIDLIEPLNSILNKL